MSAPYWIAVGFLAVAVVLGVVGELLGMTVVILVGALCELFFWGIVVVKDVKNGKTEQNPVHGVHPPGEKSTARSTDKHDGDTV